MGQEANCEAKLDRKVSQGKALLETDYVLFRGEFRVKIPFRAMKSVAAKGPWLEIAAEEGTLSLQLGPAAAEKWAQKILNPPSRLDKLGVKAGMLVSLAGLKDSAFIAELEARGATVRGRPAKDSDIIFLGAAKKADLEKIDQLSGWIKPAGGIWIVYPKGIESITEGDVLGAIRRAGLADVKVASFSATHTALKAVVRKAQRAAR
ncbi:MAG TPA: hypothetical protein VKR43_00590 [Bryobacteraceae bacterium]|nr:hypothetical protein [Bryobacteraceae bacterium]